MDDARQIIKDMLQRCGIPGPGEDDDDVKRFMRQAETRAADAGRANEPDGLIAAAQNLIKYLKELGVSQGHRLPNPADADQPVRVGLELMRDSTGRGTRPETPTNTSRQWDWTPEKHDLAKKLWSSLFQVSSKPNYETDSAIKRMIEYILDEKTPKDKQMKIDEFVSKPTGRDHLEMWKKRYTLYAREYDEPDQNGNSQILPPDDGMTGYDRQA